MEPIRVPSTTEENLSCWVKATDSPTAGTVEGGLVEVGNEADDVSVWTPGTWSTRRLAGRWEALIPISGLTKGTRYNLFVRVTVPTETPVMLAAILEAV